MQKDYSLHPPQKPWEISKSGNTEYELWNAMKAGDESCYMLIYQKYFSLLYSYGSKICSDKEVVKDSIQDLFIDIWKQRTQLSDTDSITYYLFAALKRRIIKELNRQKLLETGTTLHLLHVSDFNSEEFFITEEISDEQKMRISTAMQKLSKKQREVIQLRYFHNLGSDEIAQRLSIKVESAYNLISKSLSLLRKHLKQIPVLVVIFRLIYQIFCSQEY